MGAPGPVPALHGSAHDILARTFAQSLQRGGRPASSRMTKAEAATIPACPPVPTGDAVALIACGLDGNGRPVVCVRWLIGKPTANLAALMEDELRRQIEAAA